MVGYGRRAYAVWMAPKVPKASKGGRGVMLWRMDRERRVKFDCRDQLLCGTASFNLLRWVDRRNNTES